MIHLPFLEPSLIGQQTSYLNSKNAHTGIAAFLIFAGTYALSIWKGY
jgi:hypothetical protein